MEVVFKKRNIFQLFSRPRKVKGVIRGLWLGQWEGGPAEFMIETEDGGRFDALCGVAPEEASKKFTLGRECEIKFYKVKSKLPDTNNEYFNVVSKIALGNTPNPNIMPIGKCYFTHANSKNT